MPSAADQIEGWTLVPNLGRYVEADHPITVVNPSKAFEVKFVMADSYGFYVRGTHTCWFNVKSVKPATEKDALEAEMFEANFYRSPGASEGSA